MTRTKFRICLAIIATTLLTLCSPLHAQTYVVAGDSITDGGWGADILSLKPDVLSILIGVNDSSKEIDLTAWEAGYRALLARTRTALPNVRLVLCTPFLCPAARHRPPPKDRTSLPYTKSP